MRKRKGRIDEIEDLKTMDLVAFNGGVNPWNNPFVTAGFKPGAAYFRSTVEKWGFTGLRNVADVGSGYGRWAVFLGEVNTKVCGYERNAEAVELSRKLAGHFGLTNVSFEAADVTKLPVKDKSVDAVWCNNGLHLFPRADFLTEMHRILKPGKPLFLGQYSGLGSMLEKFFEGYPKGGMDDFLVKFALGSIKTADAVDASSFTYCSPEHIGRVLEAFGFELSSDHPMEPQMRGGAQASDMFTEEMRDIPAFVRRLEEDEAFRNEFVRYPDIANRYPVNMNVLAVKR
ncbi:MAG TPA: class I SAM-dependent methyltransferase [Rhizomicrobium sp.]|nr:class I SAM-dependent methyltransferase [Rhizomicrobium sp.]